MSAAPRPCTAEPVALYRRRVAASIERVWENVLDWEHLPWLHRQAFLSIERLESGREGWRARTRVPGVAPQELEVELQTFRAEGCYVARTSAESGGSEIWTALGPAGERATDIEVAFHVPDVAAGSQDALGRGYVAVYTELWDQDEAMMVRRQEVLDRALLRAPPEAGVHDLGDAASLRARAPVVVELGGVPLRIVALDDGLWAHAFTCPHLGGPLEERDEQEGCVRCPWHGYRFDVRSGASAEGRPLRLAFAERIEIDADGRARLTVG